MRYLIAYFCIFLAGCSSLSNEANEEPVVRLIDQHTIKYVGDTSIQNAKQFEKLLEAHSATARALLISSGGGDPFGGLRIGRLVHKYELAVIVDEVCASSCANYVVTASNNVQVQQGALLGWHGGSTQPLYTSFNFNQSWLFRIILFFKRTSAEELQSRYLEKWQYEEAEFFDSVGVHQAVTVLGMMPGLNEKRNAALFSYDRETLNRLGLSVEFEGEQMEFYGSGERVVQIFHLDEHELNDFLALHESNLASSVAVQE